MNTEAARARLRALRALAHRNCVVCGASNPKGLQADFELLDDGSIEACFDGAGPFTGYAECLHGGVISALLDGAMTNCLFAHGHTALTGELTVRFRSPVTTESAIVVRGWIERTSPPLHLLAAELRQDRQVKATGRGKFIDKPLGVYVPETRHARGP